MDVTLLLNQSAGFANRDAASRESTPPYAATGLSTAPSTALPTPSPERSLAQRESEPRQTRGRTPWNAGGYSLPLQSEDAKVVRSASTFSYRSATRDHQTDSDGSAHTARLATGLHSRHMSVDSDVSVSRGGEAISRSRPARAKDLMNQNYRTLSWDEQSMTTPRHRLSDSYSSLSSYSSRQSMPHSRISSITTISGGYPGSSSLAELPIFESSLDEQHDDDESGVDRHHRHHHHNHNHHHLFGPSSSCADDEPAYVKRLLPPPPAPQSSSSEADRRDSPPVEGFASRIHHARYPDGPRPSLSRASHLFLSPKLHKRAISAPDFASIVSGSRFPRPPPYNLLPPPHHHQQQQQQQQQTMAGPTSTSSRGRERRELVDLMSSVEDSSPELANKEDDSGANNKEDEPRCMFVANCDTGSQLRKAISHLFGRNKSCTLKIPKEVWVYYCRKHYQRIRYRNARTYPSNQMELVKVQILRLQTWSEANQAKGAGPYIKQWTLSLRKREQNRLDSGKGDDGTVVGDEDHGGSVVPDWIIQLVGDGYTTEKMLQVAERLHKDIVEGVLSQVPEIEFLPDIVDDSEGASSKPNRSRRSNSSKNPKRKANDTSRQNSVVSGDVCSPIMRGGEEDEPMTSPSGKRARLNNIERGVRPPYGSFSSSSSTTTTTNTSMHPYGIYSGGGGVPPAPTRAPHVVPKFRTLDFGAGARHQQTRGEVDEQSPPPPPMTRFGGFQPTTAAVGASVYEDSSLASFGPRFGAGTDGMPLTLPSIRTQMLPGAPRSMHQRSTSAYTLASRPVSSFPRPSSSGDEGVLYELGSSTSSSTLPSRYPLPHQHHLHQHPHHGHWTAEAQSQDQWGEASYGSYNQSGGNDMVSPCSGLNHRT
ncbi:hypothetical protein CP532_3745 [Ophiocordyceps camponoti-leonardi (nom. inval.)]|nr:hypothetical protein CP532_3745 [Ophiocordyceps camponoti-leonardi (nom. inval.)]